MPEATQSSLTRLLKQRQWKSLQHQTLYAVENGLEVRAVIALDPILMAFSTNRSLDDASISAASGGDIMTLQRALRAIREIDAKSPLVQLIADAMYRLTSATPKPRWPIPKRPSFVSLPFEQWPPACRQQFEKLRRGRGGGVGSDSRHGSGSDRSGSSFSEDSRD